jgi:anaerobic selenocysteine-containing dehydrogenase
MTDTGRLADLVLPATTQLEQVDLHKPYGHRHLQFNAPAIPPLGEARSNWDVMRLLATGMGYRERWLQQTAEEAIAEVLEASRAANPRLDGITMERLRAEGTVPLPFGPDDEVPFAGGRFPTPSGKVELRCEAMAALGLDSLPDYVLPAEFDAARRNGTGGGMGSTPGGADGDLPPLVLLTGAAHHFVTSSMANQPGLLAKEGSPFVEINPVDAEVRGIADGETVVVANERGSCSLRAVVTDDAPPGVAIAPKGRWASLSPDGRNVNWTTPDSLGDLAGQSTFHSNLVHIRPVATDRGAGVGACQETLLATGD